MIKFEHSVFALPFALTGALLAWREQGFRSDLLGAKLFWVVLAMVSARSAAMAFNRVVDAAIDGRNPRTAGRHLPAGLLTRSFTWGFVVVCSAVFVIAAAALNGLCLALSPLALFIVFLYSYTKRFTALSHLVLGLALGIAPAAAYIAIAGSLDMRIIALTAAVMFWTAGFDIIYSCQDVDFDRHAGLFSIPAQTGIGRALILARICHLAMLACLVWLAWVLALGPIALAGIALVAALLVYEHSLVSATDLSRVNAAFFTVNGYVSILFFLFWTADIILRSSII